MKIKVENRRFRRDRAGAAKAWTDSSFAALRGFVPGRDLAAAASIRSDCTVRQLAVPRMQEHWRAAGAIFDAAGIKAAN